MHPDISRRNFVGTTLAAGASMALLPGSSARAAGTPSNKVIVGVAGIHNRGLELINRFAAVPGVEIRYAIDVDQRYLANAVAVSEKAQGHAAKTETDFRRVLEDKELDALIIATPDHWHAPMATLAAKAGKHVYVEKPCSHNPREGEILVEAAANYKRHVQMGSQRRSIANVQQMAKEIQEGIIGNVHLAHCFYSRRRMPIGFGREAPVPPELNWDLWQGPAPRTAYRGNLHPYNWHWFWQWGTGEALNNGVHLMDVARWAMGVSYPTRAHSLGGRWHDVGLDDWETPDTQEIQLEFPGGKGITWFGRSCSTFGSPGYKANGIIFHGSKGTIDYDGSGTYSVYDLENKLIKKVGGSTAKTSDLANSADPGLDDSHSLNFIETIRGNTTLAAPITDGHCSTVLGQLGNISHRVGRSLKTDPANGHILDDPEAAKLWTRDYEPGWEPTA